MILVKPGSALGPCGWPNANAVGRGTSRRPRLQSPIVGRASRQVQAAHAPGRNRTCDLALRRRALYPLSYRRGVSKSSPGQWSPKLPLRSEGAFALAAAGAARWSTSSRRKPLPALATGFVPWELRGRDGSRSSRWQHVQHRRLGARPWRRRSPVRASRCGSWLVRLRPGSPVRLIRGLLAVLSGYFAIAVFFQTGSIAEYDRAAQKTLHFQLAYGAYLGLIGAGILLLAAALEWRTDAVRGWPVALLAAVVLTTGLLVDFLLPWRSTWLGVSGPTTFVTVFLALCVPVVWAARGWGDIVSA